MCETRECCGCCCHRVMQCSLHCLSGNVPPGHANVAAQHVINMPTNVTPTMYLQHHPAGTAVEWFDTFLTANSYVLSPVLDFRCYRLQSVFSVLSHFVIVTELLFATYAVCYNVKVVKWITEEDELSITDCCTVYSSPGSARSAISTQCSPVRCT